ncbi:hypothetical protein B9Z19DRAFT_1101333 [Tuber borchii]|uniref:Uncharacterized protein n=1 Tax=Tuber borchii TaxID=42251 RepID=A0A2T6ZSL0_TUBBO|nr:hypothetical protein B9Z19DRAFT_1101333 [Tuber borchii]
MSGLRPNASASSLASITSPSSGSFALSSNTHSSPLTYPQQPSSPASSPTSFPKYSHYHRRGACDNSPRSESKTPSPPSSVAEIPSIQTQSPPSPHNHRANRTSNSPITNQFLMLSGERPPSPLTLTSAPAPPSVIPMTAAGISASTSVAKSTSSSRRSPAASLKLSMLPSASASMVQPPTSAAAAATVTASQMSATSAYIHHHQAYAHSLSAQHKLQLHQKEIISQATRAAGIPPHLLSTGPMSPRLIPLGSPGPVTPLTLEDNPGGFFASHAGALEHQQLGQQLAIVASGGAMQS